MIHATVPGGVPTKLTLSKSGTTSLVVPSNRIYYLSWLALRYVADGTVATRNVGVNLVCVDTNAFSLTLSNVVASEVRKHGYGLNVNSGTSPLDYEAGPCGEFLPLYPGQSLVVQATGGVAGDSWTIEGIYYEVPVSVP